MYLFRNTIIVEIYDAEFIFELLKLFFELK